MSDVLEIFAGAFDEAASKTSGVLVGEMVKGGLTKLGYAEVFATVSSEAAKGFAEAIVGPMLRVFLKLLDPTQQKLDALLNEPLQTAVSMTEKSLAVEVISENDRHIRQEQFVAALRGFEKAYSIAGNRRKDGDVRVRIRLAQATIAKALDAPSWVSLYMKDFVATLREQIQLADAEARNAEESLEIARSRQTPEGLEKARKQMYEMLHELGPKPLPGQSSFTFLGIELGVTDKTWQSTYHGILHGGERPTAKEIAGLERELQMREAKMYRLKAFARFWGIAVA